MKLLALAILLAFAIPCNAEELVTSENVLSATMPSTEKNWMVEGQLNTASNSIQPTFGPALFFNVDEINQIGFRILAPIGYSNEGTTSIQGVYRHYFGQKKTVLFGEGNIGANWYNSDTYASVAYGTSVGTYIGLMHHLTEELAVGGVGGADWTRVYINREYAFTDTEAIRVYPKVALIGAFAF